jgi:hypothetical protein
VQILARFRGAILRAKKWYKGRKAESRLNRDALKRNREADTDGN